MTTMQPLFLDVLPVHPQPQPLESLNSYIKRLAAANHIQHIHKFALFAAVREPRFLFHNMPLPSFGRLATIAGCTDAQVLALTFYHLGRKFRREQTLGRFLSGSIASHSRYCPHCLADQGYHSLAWSFLRLVGCPTHAVYLLDHCGYCGAAIPLTSPFLSVTHCPSCKSDLRDCPTRTLSTTDYEACQQHWHDLAYLLTRQPWENDECGVAAGARQRLGFVRLEKRWMGQHVAQQLGRRPSIMVCMENETQSGKGETFQDYLRYADLLEVQLSEQFMVAEQTGYQTKEQLYQVSLEAQVNQAIDSLTEQGISVTQRHICQLIGSTPATLRHYPAIHAVLRQATLERKKRTPAHEQALCQEVQHAIEHLKANDQRISWNSIGSLVGLSWQQLKYYPQVVALIRNALPVYQQYQQLKEQDLPRRVQEAIAACLARHELPTQKTIAQDLGISPHVLSKRPHLSAPITQANRQMNELLRHTRIAHVQAAAVALKQRGIPLTQHALATEAGITRSFFQYDPELRAMWQSLAGEYAREKEDELVRQVQTAIQQLEAENKRISLRAIEQRVSLTRKSLIRYPRVLRIFKAYHLLQRANLEKYSLPDPEKRAQ